MIFVRLNIVMMYHIYLLSLRPFKLNHYNVFSLQNISQLQREGRSRLHWLTYEKTLNYDVGISTLHILSDQSILNLVDQLSNQLDEARASMKYVFSSWKIELLAHKDLMLCITTGSKMNYLLSRSSWYFITFAKILEKKDFSPWQAVLTSSDDPPPPTPPHTHTRIGFHLQPICGYERCVKNVSPTSTSNFGSRTDTISFC